MEADISFGLAALSHFVACVALQAIHAASRNLPCTSGPSAGALTSSPQDESPDHASRADFARRSSVTADGDEFLQWSASQALFSLQRATWALEQVLTFLSAVWREVQLSMAGSALCSEHMTAPPSGVNAAMDAAAHGREQDAAWLDRAQAEWEWVRSARRVLSASQNALSDRGLAVRTRDHAEGEAAPGDPASHNQTAG